MVQTLLIVSTIHTHIDTHGFISKILWCQARETQGSDWFFQEAAVSSLWKRRRGRFWSQPKDTAKCTSISAVLLFLQALFLCSCCFSKLVTSPVSRLFLRRTRTHDAHSFHCWWRNHVAQEALWNIRFHFLHRSIHLTSSRNTAETHTLVRCELLLKALGNWL